MKRKPGLTASQKYDFSGGLVTMVAKTRLAPNQLTKARNVNMLVDGEFEVRGGCVKHSTVAFGTTIDRFLHFKTDTYDKMIAWGGSYVKRLDVGTPDTWTTLSSTMPNTNLYRAMQIAQGMMFFGRQGARPMKYYPGQSVLWNDGISSPGTKPTVADSGTAGNPNGTYRYYYTYYNSTTLEESNPSPISDPVTVVNKQVTVSAFVASTDVQVDKIRIYRNPNGVTNYYYVGEKNNDTNNYTDNVADNNLGAAISFLNVVPPYSPIMLWHLNRMFYVDGANQDDIYWSEPFKPGSVPTTNKLSIEKGDGGKIVQIVSCYDNIVVLKNTGVYLLVFDAQTPLDSYYQPITAKYGCIAPMSVQNIMENIVFLSPEGLKKITNAGTNLQDITVPIQSNFGPREATPVTNLFREISKDAALQAVSVYYEAKNQYHLSIPYYSSSNNLTIVWHIDSNTFTTHDGWNVKACGSYEYYDSEYLFRSHEDQYLYRHDYGDLDNGVTPISFEVQTGWHDIDGMPDKKRLRLFFPVVFGPEGSTISFEVLKDFESAGSGQLSEINHLGASYWGYGHWGYAYWGLAGESLYRHRISLKGRVFSVRFFGDTIKRIGVAGYQIFYQPRAL